MTLRPGFSEIDAWGMTHQGKVRTENQDHFFLGALAHGAIADRTSLPPDERGVMAPTRLASLAIVADGVGSTSGAEEAARTAVQGLVKAVSHSFHEAEMAERKDPDAFSRLLQESALNCHQSLLEKAQEAGGGRKFATTLTLFLGLWPHGYLLQLGDSRCYIYKDDQLRQITRDQTWAQDLIDSGAMSRTEAEKSRWAHVLSSAIGGDEAAPVVTRIERDWGTVVLLCSDGLTKHVSDERIEEVLANLTSAREATETLVQEALDGGGTDNITVVIGRTVKPE